MTALLRSDWDPSPEFYGLFPELTVLHLQSNCSCYLLLPSPAPTAPGAYLKYLLVSSVQETLLSANSVHSLRSSLFPRSGSKSPRERDLPFWDFS